MCRMIHPALYRKLFFQSQAKTARHSLDFCSIYEHNGNMLNKTAQAVSYGSQDRMNASIFFQGGTLVLDHSDDIEHVPALFQFVKGRWRCEAYHYHEVLPWLHERVIRNAIPCSPRLALALHATTLARAYHVQALDACDQAD